MLSFLKQLTKLNNQDGVLLFLNVPEKNEIPIYPVHLPFQLFGFFIELTLNICLFCMTDHYHSLYPNHFGSSAEIMSEKKSVDAQRLI